MQFIIQGRFDGQWCGLNADGYIWSDESSPRYKTRQDAEKAMQEIKAQFDAEGGSSLMRVISAD